MIIEMELPEEEPKKETGSNKIFTQSDIRKSIKLHRENIRYIIELMKEADNEIKVEKKIEHRNKTIEDFLNGDGLI